MLELSKEVQISIEVGVEIFKDVIVNTYQGIAGFVKDKNKEHDFFGSATKKYVAGLVGRYNSVQVLGMREPVPLKSLFVRANILEKISSRMGLLRPEDLDAFFDFDKRAFGKKRDSVDGEVIVNKLQRFIVLGKPGAGKTTYLKYLTLMMFEPLSRIENRKLPVFITLREWADTGIPLLDFIVEQFDICGFEQAGVFVERMLQDGKCLVLFDGLDEVSETAKQDDIIRQIKNFADKFHDNQFIISCRVAAYNHWFEGFTEVEMADFNEAQMKTFIKNWFQGEPKIAAECWQRLKASPSLCELASTPLLLTLLCLEYGESNDFPPNRAELYRRAIDTLLTKWDSTRRIRRPEVYKKLTIRQKESMFARIAVGTFMEDQYFITERDLTRMIEKFIEHLPSVKEEEAEPDSRIILKAIETQHGIFVERAKGVYSFAHLTFQEYFTARYIVDHSREGTLEKLVEYHLYDPKWNEVFKLTAGLLDNADELLLLMQKKAHEAMVVDEINVLMMVAEQSVLPLENKYPKAFRRHYATFIALALDFAHELDCDLILDRALDLALAMDSALTLNFDHAHALDLARMRTRDLAHNRARARDLDLAFTRDLARNLSYDIAVARDISRHSALALALDSARILAFDRAGTLDLDLDLDTLELFSQTNNLNEQTILKIHQYFSANLLILHCLSSANYVSKPIREKMLREICLPKKV